MSAGRLGSGVGGVALGVWLLMIETGLLIGTYASIAAKLALSTLLTEVGIGIVFVFMIVAFVWVKTPNTKNWVLRFLFLVLFIFVGMLLATAAYMGRF